MKHCHLLFIMIAVSPSSYAHNVYSHSSHPYVLVGAPERHDDGKIMLTIKHIWDNATAATSSYECKDVTQDYTTNSLIFLNTGNTSPAGPYTLTSSISDADVKPIPGADGSQWTVWVQKSNGNLDPRNIHMPYYEGTLEGICSSWESYSMIPPTIKITLYPPTPSADQPTGITLPTTYTFTSHASSPTVKVMEIASGTVSIPPFTNKCSAAYEEPSIDFGSKPVKDIITAPDDTTLGKITDNLNITCTWPTHVNYTINGSGGMDNSLHLVPGSGTAFYIRTPDSTNGILNDYPTEHDMKSSSDTIPFDFYWHSYAKDPAKSGAYTDLFTLTLNYD